MKTAISLPDALFRRVEDMAKRLGMSRSEFFAAAAERYVDELDDEDLVAAIDAALTGVAEDTTFVRAAARRTLDREQR